MKSTFSLWSSPARKAASAIGQSVPIVLSVVKFKTQLTGLLLCIIFFSSSFAQDRTVFLSNFDSCRVHAPVQPPGGLEALSLVGSPIVRVAYVIPSNRSEQPNAVAFLQHAVRTGQQWYQDQMEQNGFGPKTYLFETEADGVTPRIHVVHVGVTDDYLRGDTWGRTIAAASDAGLSLWATGEVWVLMPETHLMYPDGSTTGGGALGAGWGSGNSPGVAFLGSDALPFLDPTFMTDDTPYDGKVLPALGPYPMKQSVSAPWFEGTTFSSIASSRLGALLHEMGHAFGLAHDYRNDNNFHGNLMFNGLRGIRGSLFPEKYPEDYTRLEYASALILNVSHYFNRNKTVTLRPRLSTLNPGSIAPQSGLVHISFQASDADTLSLAHIRMGGDAVAEIPLEGNAVDTAFAIPYFTSGADNSYNIVVHDKQGNTNSVSVQFFVPSGYNQAPIPFVRINPPVPEENESINLNASSSYDVDQPISSSSATWDVDNDGKFDTEPTTSKSLQYLYKNPGNYLIRVKLTDPSGGQVISTPVSIKIPGEKKITVESFTLLNADTDEEISVLEDGMVIDVKTWEAKRLNFRANTSDGVLDWVAFKLEGPTKRNGTDKKPPYTLFGDTRKGNVLGKKLLAGEYTLTATPFSATEKGVSLSVKFQVLERNNSVVTNLTLIDTDTAKQITVYPVPTSGVINLHREGKTDSSYVIILDINGNVLLHRPLSLTPVEQLDLRGFRKGIYYLKVVSIKGAKTFRVVVD